MPRNRASTRDFPGDRLRGLVPAEPGARIPRRRRGTRGHEPYDGEGDNSQAKGGHRIDPKWCTARGRDTHHRRCDYCGPACAQHAAFPIIDEPRAAFRGTNSRRAMHVPIKAARESISNRRGLNPACGGGGGGGPRQDDASERSADRLRGGQRRLLTGGWERRPGGRNNDSASEYDAPTAAELRKLASTTTSRTRRHRFARRLRGLYGPNIDRNGADKLGEGK